MMRKIILAVLVIFFLVSFNGFVLIYSANETLLNADNLHSILKANNAYETIFDQSMGSTLGAMGGTSIIPIDASQIKEMFMPMFEEIFLQVLKGLSAYLKDPNITAPVAEVSFNILGLQTTQTIDLSDYAPEGSYQNLKAIVQIALSAMYILLIAAVVFLVLMLVVAKTLASKLRVVGSALAISGASLAVLAFSLPSIVPALLPQLASASADPSAVFMQILIPAIASGIGSFILPIAIAVLVAGIVLVAASIILKKKGAQKPAKAEPVKKKPAKPKPKKKK